MMLKPPCKAADDTPDSVGSVFGREFAEKLVYSLFNPEEDDEADDVIEEMINEQADRWNLEKDEYLRQKYGATEQNWMYKRWVEEPARREYIKDNAWKKIVEDVKAGKLKPGDLSTSKLARVFAGQIASDLREEGYLDSHSFDENQRSGYSFGWVDFSPTGESVIAEKVLEEALLEIDSPSMAFGADVKGYGSTQSEVVTEFDENRDQYDLIDIYESSVEASLHSGGDLLDQRNLKVRVPAGRRKCSNVILIDSSNSMYGPKFRGALIASLALKKLLQNYFYDDELYVVAYDDEPVLLGEGEILKLRPQGNTDIGNAIDFAVTLLEKEDGERSIFLLTDGEPTSSNRDDLSPKENAFRAAYEASRAQVNFNMILLDQKPELRRIAETMARLSYKSSVTYVEDPAHLKSFVIRSYIASKGVRLV